MTVHFVLQLTPVYKGNHFLVGYTVRDEKNLNFFFNFFFFADERTNNWTFVSSPTLVIVLTIMYLYFILLYGPKYMQNKQAYSLKQGIRIFNIAQIVSNALITYHILEAGWYEVCSIYCVQVDYSTSPRAMKVQ